MFIDVENSVFNGILNSKKVTTIEVDRDTPSEINYLFSDGGIIKEKFSDEVEPIDKINDILDGTNFIATNDNRIINPMYIHTVKKDVINPSRIIFVLYGGAPVKEVFENEDAADVAFEEIKFILEHMSEGGGGGGEGDLSQYLKKDVAERTYAKIKSVPTKTSDITNDSDFTTKTYVDGIVGDVERLLGGI